MKKDDLYTNCRFCPEYKKTCFGGAQDCLCYRCPRNLGQCLLVKYCRETESVLDDYKNDGIFEDENNAKILDTVLKNIEK